MIWLALFLLAVVVWCVSTVIVDTRKEGFSISVSVLPQWAGLGAERVEGDLFLTAGNLQLCVHDPEIQFKLEQVEYEALKRYESETTDRYREGYVAGWDDGYHHRRLEMMALSEQAMSEDELDVLFSEWDNKSGFDV